MNIYEIRNVEVALGRKKVLKGIDLDVRKGEIMALVGPSGSGKTTLLRCLNRLIDPDSGSIRFEGKDIRSIDPVELRRSAVLVPQESIMLDGTVENNILYGPRIAGASRKVDVAGCLEDAGLPPRMSGREASRLSGGEKKRVALARALALEPRVLLLDEPTVGVDPRKVDQVERTILQFSERRRLTVVWVTHDVPQAMRVSTRIANLKDGRVREVKETSEFEWEGVY
ncbi:phosphate ABC transporter ATP-binding protein [Thermoplasmatales archaeon ex4484_6]|nr:MAG: phosphate ABC transporter ATP-binding protein [Thermoplasmatales archaeon ex4484_6]RLF67468.1 MAG: phosphate ABC transporter ATP-binding protein [Thermoplasmata archaeon]